MARATHLTELGAPIFCHWWQKMETRGNNIYLTVDDPERSGKALARTLTPAVIHTSFAELKDRYLCCGEAMAEEGYDCGCAMGAPWVLASSCSTPHSEKSSTASPSRRSKTRTRIV